MLLVFFVEHISELVVGARTVIRPQDIDIWNEP